MTQPTQSQIEAAQVAWQETARRTCSSNEAWIAALTAAAQVEEQSQIEAGEYELKCTNGHDRCYMGTSDDCPYCERIALTAAAQVGEPQHSVDFLEGIAEGKAATIDLCAHIAGMMHIPYGTEIAAAIRKQGRAMTQSPDEQAIARLAEVLADRQRKVEALSGIHNFAFEDAEQLIAATIERCAQRLEELASLSSDREVILLCAAAIRKLKDQ